MGGSASSAVSRPRRLVLLGAASMLLALATGCGSARRTSGGTRGEAASEPVQYLPRGLQTVAGMPIPGGGRLLIRAEHYRFQGRVYAELGDWVQEADGAGGGSGGVRPEGNAPLLWAIDGHCAQGSRYATVAVYGLLRVRADTVFAYAAGRPHRLRTASVPGYLYPGGAAAYGVLGEPPERIVVRTPSGRAAMDEDLGREGPTLCEHQSSVMYLRSKRG